MFGLVEWRGAGEHCAAEDKRLGGARFLAVGIRRGDGLRAAWSLRAAARALERYGVTQAVFPRGFTQYERFAARGIRPVDAFPLRAAAAAAIVRRAMAQRGIAPERATVALCAHRVTAAYAAAASELSGPVRYLRLCVDSGGEELSAQLRRTLGVAATVSAERIAERAEVALCFGEVPQGARGFVLALHDAALRIEYETDDAEEYEAEQLLSARFSAGALRAEEIAVRAVAWETEIRI